MAALRLQPDDEAQSILAGWAKVNALHQALFGFSLASTAKLFLARVQPVQRPLHYDGSNGDSIDLLFLTRRQNVRFPPFTS